MRILSLNKDIDKFNYVDLTRFNYNDKTIDIHNLFTVFNIYIDGEHLDIELKSNEYYESLYEGKKKKGELLSLVFSKYCLDSSYDTEFRLDCYNNISMMSFSQPDEVCEKQLSIDLLFDNNDFFKIACEDCYFEMKNP